MGTTLTGTTPQDTYDSLIKVTDNGPLSATAKLLTDGLGNNSILALSTTAVGIGTTSPTANLDARIAGTTSGAVIKVGNVGTGDFGGLGVSDGGTYPVQLYGSSLAFLTGNSAYASATEKVRILAGGGITFNGDTAAANALDDYEEGTFTPTFVGAAITGGNIRGSYTKIGRQVYITVQFVNATISSVAGSAQVQSLPFTNNSLHFGVASITYCDALNTTNASAWIDTASTTIVLMDGTNTTPLADFVAGTNNRSMMLNAVYQV